MDSPRPDPGLRIISSAGRNDQRSSCGEPLLRPSLQPAHGQLGPGQNSEQPVGLRLQLLGALLRLQRDGVAPQQGVLPRSEMQQVQLRHPRPGAPSLCHERLFFPLPDHLVAVRRGGEGGNAPARPGDELPPHPPHPGVSLPPPGCHGAGALPGQRAHVESPRVFCQRLRGDVWPGRGGVARRGSNLHLQVFKSFPLYQRRGDLSSFIALELSGSIWPSRPGPAHDHQPPSPSAAAPAVSLPGQASGGCCPPHRPLRHLRLHRQRQLPVQWTC